MFGLFDRFKKKRYEASIYFIRELEEPPEREDDLPYFLTRLHDIYVKKRKVTEVFKYVEDYIKTPTIKDSGIWIGVLLQYEIPFLDLQWDVIEDLEPNAKKSVFSCLSTKFYNNADLVCRLQIKVYCEHKEKYKPVLLSFDKVEVAKLYLGAK